MGLSKEIADLIQKDTDTNIRIDDLELAVEDIESEVVKVTDEDYKKGPNYFTNTPLMEPADNGEEITTIRSDFINADSKLQVGMTQQGLPPETPINNVTITINAYDIIPVYIYFARNIRTSGTYISGYSGDDHPAIIKYPFDGCSTSGTSEYIECNVLIPVSYNITISPEELQYTKLPIIYTEGSYSDIEHLDFGYVSGVIWSGLTYTYSGYYSTGKVATRSNVKGLYQPSISIDPKYEETNRQITPALGSMSYNSADIDEFIGEPSTSKSIEYWYDPDYEVNTKWEVTRTFSCEGNKTIDISGLISWDSETNSYIFNGGSTLISGSAASGDTPESRVFGCFSFGGSSSVESFKEGLTSRQSSFASSNGTFVDSVNADLWGNHDQWKDYEPSNSNIYNYSKTDMSTPNLEGVNASGSISSVIDLTDGTKIYGYLPVFYIYERYDEFFEARHYNKSDDVYHTNYTYEKYLEYKEFEENGYIKELPNNYDVLLGSKNRTINNEHDVIYKNNNSYLGIENYIFGNVKNTKVIGNYNHLYLNEDSAIIIGNYNETKTLQRDDILISNDGVGFIIRNGKQYLHFKDNLIPMDNMYSLSRYSEDESYICLMNFNGDILSKIYAPLDIGTTYTLSSDDTGIYIKDDKTNIKQYIKWYNVTEEEYVDIFNNIDDYKDVSEVLW